ncbi:MAG: amidohydrolase family protein [Bacteroidota bacterium]
MIDAHVHFWQYEPVRDSWITPEMAILRQDYLPDAIASELSYQEVTGCIAVQADQSETETHFLLALAKQYPFIKGVVGWTDLTAANLEEKLAVYTKNPLIKGWRHIVQAEPDGFLLQPAFIKGIKTIKDYDYTYDILIRHDQLPEVIKFLDKVGNQRFVLDHCAKPDLKSKEIKTWAQNIRTVAQQEHVFCKLSGLFTEGDWAKPDEKLIFETLDTIFEHFGPLRVLFGSDWPVMLLASNYAEWLKLIKKYTENFTASEKQSIFNNNALKFYNS